MQVISERKKELEQIDSEKSIYSKYLEIRSAIPRDEGLDSMSGAEIQSLYLRVVQQQVEAHSLEPVDAYAKHQDQSALL